MRLVLILFLFYCLPLLLVWQSPAQALTFVLPTNGDNVVGAPDLAFTQRADTLSDLARTYDQGFVEMRLANPGVDVWLPGQNTELLVPAQYILPAAPRDGIVINISEMRLYYFPRPVLGVTPQVVTFPISIGRQDWSTPHGTTTIISKVTDPAWRPPESIRKEHAEDGDPLPKIVPPGPDNPLGKFSLRLGLPGYLIHGTNKPYGVGMRVTHGCIRLYPEDIKQLFQLAAVGTPVHLVNQPFKVGRLNGQVFLEAHPTMLEDAGQSQAMQDYALGQLASQVERSVDEVDWNKVDITFSKQDGVPNAVSSRRVWGHGVQETQDKVYTTSQSRMAPTEMPGPANEEPMDVDLF